MSQAPHKPHPFHVALTADFYNADATSRYADLGLSAFHNYPHITHNSFAEHRKQIDPDQTRGCQGVIVLTPHVTSQSVSEANDLLAIGRFGVGYDSVDVKACTEADVVVFITAGAAIDPVAEACVGWMIGLTHHMRTKDNLIRTGHWDDRSKFMGRELRDRTLGVIGLGGIAKALINLLKGWGMNPPIAFDPFLTPAAAKEMGVHLVSLEELLKTADFVSVHCPLTEKTRGLIGHKELAMMKREAYLLNTARGGIADEDALYEALQSHRIAGAALDCFAEEPVTHPHRFALDNVLLAPHSIAWTDELFRDIGRAAAQGMVDLSLCKKPRGVVNPQVFDRAKFPKEMGPLVSVNVLWLEDSQEK